MTEVGFYQLTRVLQDNLLLAFKGEFQPQPIVWFHGRRRVVIGWLASTAASVLLLAALVGVGFGALDSPLSVHPIYALGVYALLVAAAVLGIVQALAYRHGVDALPFAPGVYLFPAKLIDARDETLRMFALSELTQAEVSAAGVVVAFGAKRFVFPRGAAEAEQIVQRIQDAKAALLAANDDAALRRLDPLKPPLVPNPLAPTVPFTPRAAPSWLRFRWGVVALAGVLVGAVAFFARNHLSDARMFAAAQARNDVAAYESYLVRGENHRAQVSEVLLPRAALRAAMAEGSVEAIDAFLRTFPKTGIPDEVAAARRTALNAAFERARAVGKLGPLMAFDTTYADHGLAQQVKDAKHAIYRRELVRFRKSMPEGSPSTAAFVERLINAAERIGPKKEGDGLLGAPVEVRFRRVPSNDLERAGELVKKSPMYNGKPSLPAQYVDAEHLGPQEQRAAKAIAEALGRGFDREILSFSPAATLSGGEDELPKVEVPTLVVSYRVEPSGAAYASRKPRGIFIGLVFFCKADFLLPGEEEPHTVRHTISHAIPVEVIEKETDTPPSGSLEAKLYDHMVERALREFHERYLSSWLRERDIR
jgi:hypothetical protein